MTYEANIDEIEQTLPENAELIWADGINYIMPKHNFTPLTDADHKQISNIEGMPCGFIMYDGVMRVAEAVLIPEGNGYRLARR